MAFELKVPDIGEGLTEAEIVEWLVAVGDTIAANQPIVSVETAKAVVEISAPRAGVLLHHGAPEGTVMNVGELLAVIGDAGETWSGDVAPAVPAAAERTAPTAPASSPAAGAAVRAVPLVRKLAKDLGVDLATVTGTGPNGQITRSDVEAAASTADEGPDPTGEPVTLSATRKAIARNMAKSWEEIPHVTVWGPADGTGLLAAHGVSGGPLEALLVQAVVPALREFPDFNATFDGSDLVRSATIELGIAIDTEAGLMVPVLSDAADRSPQELRTEVERLVAAAQNRTLTPAELTGSTFTISNVGAVGGGYGTPIIPHGTTAILSVGRAKDDVVVRDEAIVIAPVIPLALSFDHRVIDGASAARFLNRVVEEIETLGE